MNKTILRLLLVLSFLLPTISLHAETIPAIYDYQTAPRSIGIPGQGASTCHPTFAVYAGSDAGGACTQWWSTSKANCPTNTAMQGVTASATTDYQCAAGNWGTSLNTICPTGYSWNYTTKLCRSNVQAYTCPDASYTLQGTNCVRPDCPNGRNPDGSCKNPCQAVADLMNGQTAWYSVPVGSGNAMGSFCDSGCAVSLGVAAPGYYTDGKNNSYQRTKHYSGKSCTNEQNAPTQNPDGKAPSEPPKNPPCASGEGVMTSSSGKVACVPSGTPNSNPPVVNKTSETTKNPDGTTKTTETTTTRDPATGVEDKQTTTTTKDANGTTTGTTTSSGTSGSTNGGNPESPNNSDFCQKNPGLQICKGGMNEEATQKKVLEAAEKIRDRIGEVENIDEVKNATATPSEKQAADDKHAEALGKINDKSFNAPAAGDQAGYRSELSTWFDAVPMTGCQAISSTIGNRTFTLDPCPTAAKISEIAGYCLWFGLVVSGFALVTRRAE